MIRPAGALRGLYLLLALSACAPPPAAPTDTRAPPARIVSLAPHLTEMAYAAGAGDRLVGAVEFSDYPAAARQLPRIGDAFRVDYERLAALSPDLILAWRSGNPNQLIEQLRGFGYRVEAFDAASLDNLSGQLLRLGELAGTPAEAERAAQALDGGLQALADTYREAAVVRVFFQVAREPLFTVSDRHVIGQLIRLCGGANVFGGLADLTPVVGVESVLDAAPDVILLGGPPDEAVASRDDWRQWTALPAAVRDQIHAIDVDLVSRPGPRLLLGATQVCELLDVARARLALSPAPSAR